MKYLYKAFVLVILLLMTALFTFVVSADEATPEADTETIDYALEWPVPMPSDEQIEAAQSCDFENLPGERYPEVLSLSELADAYEPEDACDWAVLALAYRSRVGEDEDAPEEGKQAYIQAVHENPAIAFSLSLLVGYFGQVDLVAPPSFAEQSLKEVDFTFSWVGLGASVNYSVTIENVDDEPIISGSVEVGESGFEPPAETPTKHELPATVDAKFVQALGPALSDLLPMKQQFTETPCWDNYPDWTVKLTFVDDTTVTMVTNQSNVIFSGGPWQTKIDGQNYMQHSTDFLIALLSLTDALGLPYGETAAYGCGSYSDPLFDAFPGTLN